MASDIVKQLCIRCNKDGEIATCSECQQWLGAQHSNEQQQELATPMDHIGQEHDLLQLDLIQKNDAHRFLPHIITQKIVWVEEAEKCSFLLDLLKIQAAPDALTLIFVKTKRAVDMIDEFLEHHQHAVASIHGNRSQAQRQEALKSFKIGRTPILVATSVALRGLYIIDIKYVINFDLPSNIYEYLERIERITRVDMSGHATSFFNEENRNIAADLLDILIKSHQEVPEWFEGLARVNKNDNDPRRPYNDGRASSSASGFEDHRSVGGSYDHNAQQGDMNPEQQQ